MTVSGQKVGGDTRREDDAPTILFFHGISQPIEDFAAFLLSLDIPPHYRILIPEQSGHGKDIERARINDGNYVHPTNQTMLETTIEFLDVVHCGKNTSGFGISLGGAVLYYVAHARPDIIQKSILVSPGLAYCIDPTLLRGILDGTNNFFCFESRNDVKVLFRDLTTGREENDVRKKKDPVPKFFYEGIYRKSLKMAPRGHYKELLLGLISSVGLDDEVKLHQDGMEKGVGSSGTSQNEVDPFKATIDIDQSAQRLVIWPEKDKIINFDRGMNFFQVRRNTDGTFFSESKGTRFESIPDCGHVFDARGKIITDIIRASVREYLIGNDV